MRTRYYTISSGLRGCYMPDSTPYVVACETRRELRDVIEDECDMRGDVVVGLSKRNVASFAAECWRRYGDQTWQLNMVLPYKDRRQDHYAFGIFVARATRVDYLESQDDQ